MNSGEWSDRDKDVHEGALPTVSAIVCVNDIGHITYLNDAAQRLLELTPEDYGLVLSDALPELAQVLPENEDAFQTREVVRLRSGKSLTAIIQSEPIASDTRCLLIQDLDASSLHLDRRRRAEQLQAASKMASRLSHEINNPLAAVIAGLQTLESETYLHAEDRFVLGLVLEEVRTIHRIMESFSEFTRVDPSKVENVRPIDILERCIAAVAPLASKKHVIIKLGQGPEDVTFYADERALIQALTRLVWNAVEASPPDAALSLGWRELGGHETEALLPGFRGRVLGIFGEDRGKGLPEDLSISTIFRPFVTTKASSVGLGLSVAQEIIERHGGVVVLCSRRGGGAIFEALFPIADDTERIIGSSAKPCAITKELKSRFCWILKGAKRRTEHGIWTEECRMCSHFRARNLTVYHKPRADVEKDRLCRAPF